eukprot:SAG22_NODE_516_length_9563_cov_29.476965_5_plen_100_part_00
MSIYGLAAKPVQYNLETLFRTRGRQKFLSAVLGAINILLEFFGVAAARQPQRAPVAHSLWRGTVLEWGKIVHIFITTKRFEFVRNISSYFSLRVNVLGR